VEKGTAKQYQHTPKRVGAGAIDAVFGTELRKIARAAAGTLYNRAEYAEERSIPDIRLVTVTAAVQSAIGDAL
jgi:hypothetical protein